MRLLEALGKHLRKISKEDWNKETINKEILNFMRTYVIVNEKTKDKTKV